MPPSKRETTGTTSTPPETSPSPEPSTEPVTLTTAPRFLPPEPSPTTLDPSPSPSPAPETAATSPGWSDAWRADEPREEAQSRPKSGESRASSLADRKAIEEAAAAAVLTVTTLVHQRVAGDDPAAIELGVFLADEQDVDGISKPAAALVARRAGGIGGNPDLNDLIGLGIALAGYAVKQFGKLRALRIARQQANVAGFQSEPETPAPSAEPAPAPIPVRGW